MGCRSILAVAAVAASLFGVDASPCKPATSTVVSVVQSERSSTVVSEAESTTLVDISLTLSTGALPTDATSETLVETTSTAEDTSLTLLETTLTTLVETAPTTVIDSTSTQLLETTPTTVEETTPTTLIESISTTSIETIATTEATTSAVLTEESSTTLAASTTTTQAESCTETQVIQNPGFDDEGTTGRPWTRAGSAYVDNNPYYSGPYSMTVILYQGDSDISISQPLRNLKGRYLLSYRWKIHDTFSNQEFTCNVEPKIGNTLLEASNLHQVSDSFVKGTAEWSTVEDVDSAEFKLVIGCSGPYGGVQINLDDVTLTKVCGA